jgi:hypothetical protein
VGLCPLLVGKTGAAGTLFFRQEAKIAAAHFAGGNCK